MGDSTGTPPSMAKTVLAGYVHRLLDHLGHRENVQVVAHDFGVGVAYPLAAQYREQVAGLFLMDFGLVGKNLKFATLEPMSGTLLQQAASARGATGHRPGRDLPHLLLQGMKTAGENVSDDELAEFVRCTPAPRS